MIKLANDTTYGLAAAVFTSSISTAVNVSNQLEAGSVCKYHMFSTMYVNVS